jgi:hypothetical protein
VRTLRSHRPVTDRDLPDADVVIATWWETAEWVARLAPSKGAKCYFIQHHEVFDWLPVERVRSTYRLPLHKIVIARWLASLMKNEYGDAHVDLVPNSVDHRQFFAAPRSKQAKPTVGFIYSPLRSRVQTSHCAPSPNCGRCIPNWRSSPSGWSRSLRMPPQAALLAAAPRSS